MDRFQEPVRKAVRGIKPRDGRVEMYSTMLGRLVRGTELNEDYWAANFREPVLFGPAVMDLGATAFVELSPHPTLDISFSPDAVSVASLRRDEPEQEALFRALGELWSAGYPVDFAKVNPPGRRRRPDHPLPDPREPQPV